MAADILLAFRQQQLAGESVPVRTPTLERSVAALAEVAGVLAAREFAVDVVLGERPPAFYPELVICRLDPASFDGEAALAALGIGEGERGLERADRSRFAVWEATSLGVRSDFDLPAHLYLQFSVNPPSLSFDAYSDWYQVHQDENIAQSGVLRRGWRFRLHPRVSPVLPGPSHLALYEMEGKLERLTADLGSAMRAGVISLPDWFDRFASLEGVAVAECVGRAAWPPQTR